jgi:hypothetical protein
MKKRALLKAKEIETGGKGLISGNERRNPREEKLEDETKSTLSSPKDVIRVKRQNRKQSVNTARKI